MAKGKMIRMEKEEYQTIVKKELSSMGKMGKLLSDMATLIDRSGEASITLLEDVNKFLDNVDDLKKGASSIRSAMMVRGRTLHHDLAETRRKEERQKAEIFRSGGKIQKLGAV